MAVAMVSPENNSGDRNSRSETNSSLPPPSLPRLGVPSRNPLPLSASQEAQVRDVYHARVRRHCAEEIKGMVILTSHFTLTFFSAMRTLPYMNIHIAFAACAANRTVTIPFVCRTQNRAMNACMLRHATTEEEDAAREEWFARRVERQKEREHKARRAREQERFMKEWWRIGSAGQEMAAMSAEEIERLKRMEKEERRRDKEMEEKLARGERVGGFRSRRIQSQKQQQLLKEEIERA